MECVAGLVAAFNSIPAARYAYRPTPSQQTVGYIAQHLEAANYSLCERLGDTKHARTAKDSLGDTLKARWPKDTLVARLATSLRFCTAALEQLGALTSPASVLPQFVGVYDFTDGLELEITMRDGALAIRSMPDGAVVRLWPESASDFFINEVDAQVTFTRDAGGLVTGLVLHQYGRLRSASKVR